MKPISLLFIICPSFLAGQSFPDGNKNAFFRDTCFRLTFSMFNHAQRIYEGTTTYVITGKSIEIYNTALFAKESRRVYKKRLPEKSGLIEDITQLRLDTLHKFYINNCVLITSGNEYFLDLQTTGIDKSVWLHHYYLKELEELAKLVNKHIPEKRKIRYLAGKTPQDCPLFGK